MSPRLGEKPKYIAVRAEPQLLEALKQYAVQEHRSSLANAALVVMKMALGVMPRQSFSKKKTGVVIPKALLPEKGHNGPVKQAHTFSISLSDSIKVSIQQRAKAMGVTPRELAALAFQH